LHSTQKSAPAVGRIMPGGRIEYGGKVFDSPSTAGSEARGGKATNGWTFWAVATPNGMTPISALRDAFLLSIT
jgi:hypothetical protein